MIAGVGVVKIGISKNPIRRLILLQTGHSRPLKIIRLFEGGAEEEAKLHAMFADVRVKGEWFSFVPEMLGDVGLVEVSTAKPPRKRQPPPKPKRPKRPEQSEVWAPAEFLQFQDGLVRAFGSLRNASKFMDNMAGPWVAGRLEELDCRLMSEDDAA